MSEKLLRALRLIRSRSEELYQLFKAWIEADRRRLVIVAVFSCVLFLYMCSRGEDKVHYVYHEEQKKFSQERIIENPYKHIAENKIEMVEESEDRLKHEIRELQRQTTDVKQALEQIKAAVSRTPQSDAKPSKESNPDVPPSVKTYEGAPSPPSAVQPPASRSSSSRFEPKTKFGPFSVAFPVQVKREEKGTGVLIPSGSYVKAKIVSGVQVPMGETYPVLLQLDYAFAKPNNRHIDLSGCFIVAKAEGDISTERLKLAPYSMSCYNTDGLAFKKEKLIGWASDPTDNDFALKAEVNLNQGRLAQTAFAKALIDGVGASLERNTRSIGGKGIDDNNPEIILKESGTKVGSLVADYYMSYLQGLRPTMKVGSGRDAWLVLGTDIDMPFQYFRKEESGENPFQYVTDLVFK